MSLTWTFRMGTDLATPVRTVRYRLTGMVAWQTVVAASEARFRVVCAGRRTGKTRLAVGLATKEAIEGKRGWWVAPTSPLAAVGWRGLRAMGRKVPGATVRLVERKIEFPSGGWVQVRTAAEPGGLISEGLDFVIYDEAARGSEESWTQELRPALTDRKGWALFISTPLGRANWFYGLYRRGESGDPAWASFHFPTSANPFIDEDEISAAEELLPRDVFDQEYMAEFNDAGSSPFDADDVRAMAEDWAGLHEHRIGGEYVTAWDIGRRKDPTVGITIDYGHDPYQVVAFERFERMPYPAQQAAIAERHNAYPGRTVVESNGPGDPVVENLPVKVEAFQTGTRSKVNAIQALRALLERRAIRADIPHLTGELLAYEWDDKALQQDCVMALAIAALHLPAPDNRTPSDPPVGPGNRTASGSYRDIQL
jgi:hypothetical protein